VSYFQAGGIDRPLVIWKSGVGSVVTHQNWRGQFARGTWGAGHALIGQSSDCSATYTGQNCVPVPWPGWNTGPWFQEAAKPQTVGSERYWLGSLSVEMRDASGLMYKRNRYYNPQTAQFTQPDPIGLSGGLNIYGFAAGDPVSYSDPYGLCPFAGKIRSATLKDCPAGEILDAFRLIRRYGGTEGAETINRTAARRLNISIGSQEGYDEQSIRDGLFPQGRAHITGDNIYISRGNGSVGGIASLIVHEVGHDRLDGTYDEEEPAVKAAQLKFYRNLPPQLRTDDDINVSLEAFMADPQGYMKDVRASACGSTPNCK
jgi:RHS repeat-associated protein